jgi:hypothetical protein
MTQRFPLLATTARCVPQQCTDVRLNPSGSLSFFIEVAKQTARFQAKTGGPDNRMLINLLVCVQTYCSTEHAVNGFVH